MIEADLTQIQDWVRQWGYLGIVLLMLLESAPLIGLMLPGIFITISLGTLTASGVLSFEQAWLYASLGAALGDSLGYWSGRLGSKELHGHLHKTQFLKKRSTASGYLSRYGAAGAAVGRFVWFVHPLVPSLAGISGISPHRFYLYDLPACLLWVGLYLGVGHGFSGIWL